MRELIRHILKENRLQQELKQFIIDAMGAKPAAAWPDFVEAINNGSIFSIVTARGHTPSVLKEGVYNYIVSNTNGIDSNELVKNLEKSIILFLTYSNKWFILYW